MKKCRIFCDVYGANVNHSECMKCKLKKDCIKVKLPILNNKDLIKFI
ncbi:hypothetical protein Metbo_1119 [Methanobacterium lacus]|uniref:Uncharacterized protein n=1 Tax=Methanobacterium lacus (strain AL-21) TaxID=877455 RepID=F0T5X1_METLA|nr:hypothetical protein Metbo_1119 [Methanobacterium lacus]